MQIDIHMLKHTACFLERIFHYKEFLQMRYILSKIQPQNIQKLESVKIYNHSKAKHENNFKQQIACWSLKLQ